MARLPERKVKPLCEVTVVTSDEAEDAVAELLQRIFKETASIYSNRDKEVSAVTVAYAILFIAIFGFLIAAGTRWIKFLQLKGRRQSR